MPLFGRSNQGGVAFLNKSMGDLTTATTHLHPNSEETRQVKRSSLFAGIRDDVGYLVKHLETRKPKTREDPLDWPQGDRPHVHYERKTSTLPRDLDESGGLFAVSSEPLKDGDARIKDILGTARIQDEVEKMKPNTLHTMTGMYRDKEKGDAVFFRVRTFFSQKRNSIKSALGFSQPSDESKEHHENDDRDD